MSVCGACRSNNVYGMYYFANIISRNKSWYAFQAAKEVSVGLYYIPSHFKPCLYAM